MGAATVEREQHLGLVGLVLHREDLEVLRVAVVLAHLDRRLRDVAGHRDEGPSARRSGPSPPGGGRGPRPARWCARSGPGRPSERDVLRVVATGGALFGKDAALLGLSTGAAQHARDALLAGGDMITTADGLAVTDPVMAD